ncbi:YciI family protein [Lysobacter antibioticus]|uniref:YciI family protein n=1 Tax=Lysobacter antibioticus TaxID=84531 RepID=UPI0007172EAC|nr:YciI family protein [Lysobacter antibioticus]
MTAMNTFVILFRRDRGSLSEAERLSLGRDIGAWARRHNEAGHQLAPRLLAPESRHIGPHRGTVEADPLPITALLFLEARDLDEAARVAESHPGMRHGFTVEVRAWSAPNPTSAPANATP